MFISSPTRSESAFPVRFWLGLTILGLIWTLLVVVTMIA